MKKIKGLSNNYSNLVAPISTLIMQIVSLNMVNEILYTSLINECLLCMRFELKTYNKVLDAIKLTDHNEFCYL